MRIVVVLGVHLFRSRFMWAVVHCISNAMKNDATFVRNVLSDTSKSNEWQAPMKLVKWDQGAAVLPCDWSDEQFLQDLESSFEQLKTSSCGHIRGLALLIHVLVAEPKNVNFHLRHDKYLMLQLLAKLIPGRVFPKDRALPNPEKVINDATDVLTGAQHEFKASWRGEQRNRKFKIGDANDGKHLQQRLIELGTGGPGLLTLVDVGTNDRSRWLRELPSPEELTRQSRKRSSISRTSSRSLRALSAC